MIYISKTFYSTLILFFFFIIIAHAQEEKGTIKLGFNYGLGTQQNFPFDAKDYNYDTRSYKGQINYVIASKRKWNFELLFEPGIYISEHQLLNKFYIQENNHDNYLELREKFTKKKTIHEYTVGVGFISRYKIIKNLSSYALFSVGPTLLNKSTERLDKGFAFSDVFALGLSYNASIVIVDFRLGVKHTSNGGLNKKNSGHNSAIMELGFLFLL